MGRFFEKHSFGAFPLISALHNPLLKRLAFDLIHATAGYDFKYGCKSRNRQISRILFRLRHVQMRSIIRARCQYVNAVPTPVGGGYRHRAPSIRHTFSIGE